MSSTAPPGPSRTSPARRAAVIGCRILGALLVAAAIALAYADRVVFDADAFAERAAQSLHDPRVAGYLGERVADEVIAQKRDLTAFRPVIVAAARTTVASEPFRALFRHAARSAHAVALSAGAEKVYLSLPDVGVLVRSALSSLSPELAARVPSDLRARLAGEVEVTLGRGALPLIRLGHRLKQYTRLALGTGVLLLGLSVILPRNRRRGLLRTGVALVVTAIALVVLPPLVGGALVARVADPDLRAAVRGVWDAFAGGLQPWALALAGIGVVLAAAASSLASHVEVETALQGAWSWLQRPGIRPATELLRALALVALGLLAVFEPGVTVQLLTVLIGAALAFEGLRSLFALVAPHVDEAIEERAERRAARGPAWPRYGLIALVALGLVGGAIVYLRSPASLPAPRPVVSACNGSPVLCDRRLDEVTLDGAHNAMAAADIPGWMFPNQERGMPAQLRHGIRALLFDVHRGTPVAGRIKTDIEDEAASRKKFEAVIGKEGVDAAMRIRDRLVGPAQGPSAPYLCHGFCELGAQPLVPVLGVIRDFLVENPGEVVLIVIEDYVAPADIAVAFEQSGLLRLVYRGTPGPAWPTLGEMVASDQRVVVLGENETGGVPWYHRAYDVMQETPYSFKKPEDFSCRPNRGEATNSLFLLNHWIESTPTPKPSNALIVNTREFLLARARQCERERGRRPNVLAVDFAMTGDVVGAAAALNGLE